MAVFVTKSAYVMINGVDLTDHVKQVTLNTGFDMQDVTAMSGNTRISALGLKSWSVDIDFFQDFASAKVDATLNGLIGGAAVTVAVRPTNAVKGTSNPEYTGSAILESYTPVDGNVGDATVVKATFKSAGDLTRATA